MPRCLKIILLPLGSSGDVHPLLWLGTLMRARGHEVVTIVHAQFGQAAAAAGLRVVTVGAVKEFATLRDNPALWHPRRSFRFVFAHIIPEAARQMLPLVLKEIDPGRTLIVAGGMALAGHIAAERTGSPLVSVQLQPWAFLSATDPSVPVVGMGWFTRAPPFLRRVLMGLFARVIDRPVAQPINALRAAHGLNTPVRKVMSRYLFNQGVVLALFPDWFAARQPDWPARAVTSRFPLYDEGDHHAPLPELDAWLGAGTPPLLLTPGSANSHASSFFTAGLEAARMLKMRALCVTPFANQLPGVLPDGARQVAYVPFSQVFPRCAAVVHPGGIGTVAQVLAAGVPQLLMPLVNDQPDNAARIRRMGVGDFLYPKQFTADAVAACLSRLLHAPETHARCQKYKDLVAAQWEPGRVAAFLEKQVEGGVG